MSLRFPQDLIQAGDVKCSLDALLLAAFVQGTHERVVELGAGCGVIGLGLLLLNTAGSVVGLEKDEVQLEIARRNARQFGLEDRYEARQADFEEDRNAGKGADLAVCNPPWRLEGAERLPVSARRRIALYGTERTLALFAGAGASRLRRGGLYVCVVGAQRLADMICALAGAGLRRRACVLPIPGPVGRPCSPSLRRGIRAKAFCAWSRRSFCTRAGATAGRRGSSAVGCDGCEETYP